MWNDPEQDGVNGNERVYQENTEFDHLCDTNPVCSMDSPVSSLHRQLMMRLE